MDYYKSLFGQNNAEWFLNRNNNIEFQMREVFKLNREHKITINSKNSFIKTNFCWLCDKKSGNVVDKVEHHCKLTGISLGAAHQSCIDYVNKAD